MERMLVHGPGDRLGEPYRLDDWQKRFLLRLYEYDPSRCEGIRRDGGPHSCQLRHRRALLGVAQGNAKTELMAAVAIEGLVGPTAPRSPEVRVAAASFEQADVLFGTAKAMIAQGPLAPHFDLWDTEIRPKDRPGLIKRIAAVAGTTRGGRTTRLICDELHEWTGSKEAVHAANSTSLAKRANGLELNITTAGADQNSLLGRLYDHGRRVASGEIDDPTFLFEWYEADRSLDLDDPAQLRLAIRQANPASWADVERIALRYADGVLAEHEFRRLHLNQWAQAPERWISADAWAACAKPERRLRPGEPIAVGFDGSSTRDNTALVAATLEEPTHLVVLGIWEPSRGQPQVDRETVAAKLWETMQTYDVRSVWCDPAGWTSEIQEWANVWGEERVLIVPQTPERMAPAADEFRADVLGGRLTHDGHPGLAWQVGNAVTRPTRWGLSIRKDGVNSPRKIDAAVAAILARAAAVRVRQTELRRPRGPAFVSY
jgi:phage terminase large subunit-like protein